MANKLTLPAAVSPWKEPVTVVFYMFCLICLIVISLESKHVAMLSANYWIVFDWHVLLLFYVIIVIQRDESE